MNIEHETMNVNGVDYVRADQVQTVPTGQRAVVVVDRGWIFAGDVTEENGRIKLTRPVWVFRWKSIGFDKVIADPRNGNVELRQMTGSVDIPADAEVFRVPVPEDWGL